LSFNKIVGASPCALNRQSIGREFARLLYGETEKALEIQTRARKELRPLTPCALVFAAGSAADRIGRAAFGWNRDDRGSTQMQLALGAVLPLILGV
jgi:hypothetical protein